MTSRKLNIYVKEPFKILENRDSFSIWRATVNDVRTFFLRNPDFSIPSFPILKSRNCPLREGWSASEDLSLTDDQSTDDQSILAVAPKNHGWHFSNGIAL